MNNDDIWKIIVSIGVFVILFIALTAAIISAAPYLALIIIVIALLWYFRDKLDDDLTED